MCPSSSLSSSLVPVLSRLPMRACSFFSYAMG